MSKKMEEPPAGTTVIAGGRRWHRRTDMYDGIGGYHWYSSESTPTSASATTTNWESLSREKDLQIVVSTGDSTVLVSLEDLYLYLFWSGYTEISTDKPITKAYENLRAAVHCSCEAGPKLGKRESWAMPRCSLCRKFVYHPIKE